MFGDFPAVLTLVVYRETGSGARGLLAWPVTAWGWPVTDYPLLHSQKALCDLAANPSPPLTPPGGRTWVPDRGLGVTGEAKYTMKKTRRKSISGCIHGKPKIEKAHFPRKSVRNWSIRGQTPLRPRPGAPAPGRGRSGVLSLIHI